MGLPTGELQAACIARYRGDVTLQGLLMGATAPIWNIFDATGVPTNTPPDYIVVQQVTVQTGTVLSAGNDAADVLTLVSIFTEQAGFAHARALASQVNTLTCRRAGAVALTLANGYTAIWTQRAFYNEVAGADGLKEQITMHYLSWITG